MLSNNTTFKYKHVRLVFLNLEIELLKEYEIQIFFFLVPQTWSYWQRCHHFYSTYELCWNVLWHFLSPLYSSINSFYKWRISGYVTDLYHGNNSNLTWKLKYWFPFFFFFKSKIRPNFNAECDDFITQHNFWIFQVLFVKEQPGVTQYFIYLIASDLPF